MAAVRVIEPGLLTTVQDEGRWGFQASGVPVAGAMDPWSHRLVNALVGNSRWAASLEVTMAGPELVFEDQRLLAIAGADFDVTLNGQPVSNGSAVIARVGSCLHFGLRRRGARAYIGIEGGIAVPPVLGSRATHLLTAMGGLNGRPLEAGDRLPLGERRSSAVGVPAFAQRGAAHVEAAPRLEQPARLRVLPGPNPGAFTVDALDLLQGAPYRVGPASNRMGFRLEGPTLAPVRAGDIISDATPLGALQVPVSGQPILLMADRQTTGGYPKIAIVISADIAVAAQLAPGDAVTFVPCSTGEALAALAAQERALMAIETEAAS